MEEQNVNVSVEEVGPLVKKFSFTVPWKLVSVAMEKEYAKVKNLAKVDGFRKGKAPRSIISKMFGEKINEEMINSLISKYYWEEIERQAIVPIALPRIEQDGVKKEQDFVFSATVELEPSFDPIGYEAMSIEKEASTVSEEDIEKRVEEIREMYATLEPEEGVALNKGSFASISFQGICDGVSRDDMKAQDYLLEVGSQSFIPGFEEGLLGMHIGETKEISLTFPDNYHNEGLRSKDVVFTVTLNGVKTKVIPPLTEEFLKNMGAFNSLEAFRERVKEMLIFEKEKENESKLRDSIIEKLLEMNIFSVPPSYVEKQMGLMAIDMRNRLVSQGMDKELAMQASMSQHEGYREIADKIVKTMLLLREIATKEGITVTEEEVDEEVARIAVANQMDAKKMKDSMMKNNGIEKIRFELFDNKVFSFIKDRAQITEKQVSTEVRG